MQHTVGRKVRVNASVTDSDDITQIGRVGTVVSVNRYLVGVLMEDVNPDYASLSDYQRRYVWYFYPTELDILK